MTELKHYGVKGMKWGVRRKSSKPKVEASDDFKERLKNSKVDRRTLSNAQLKRLNERLQLEKTNNELQSRDALNKIKKGTAAAATVLAIGTTMTTAYNLVKSPVGQGIINVFKK